MISFTSLFAQERGKASFYSNRIHGRHMADGSMYHKDSLICAHRTHPFGTLLYVTNLSNNKSVIVEVRDRGPYRRGRVIDLSYGAAQKLDMIRQGVAMVEVKVVPENIIPLILDYNCGQEEIKFLPPYEYTTPVIQYTDTFGTYLNIKKVKEVSPYMKKHPRFKRKH